MILMFYIDGRPIQKHFVTEKVNEEEFIKDLCEGLGVSCAGAEVGYV